MKRYCVTVETAVFSNKTPRAIWENRITIPAYDLADAEAIASGLRTKDYHFDNYSPSDPRTVQRRCEICLEVRVGNKILRIPLQEIDDIVGALDHAVSEHMDTKFGPKLKA